MNILFVLGPTGSGKSSLVDALDRIDGVSSVRVGRELTKRHPIEYFNGEAAPLHTQQDALSVVVEGVGRAFKSDSRLCVVDGYPRRPESVIEVFRRWPSSNFVNVYCEESIRKERIGQRDGVGTDRFLHSMKRMETEERDIYRVISEIGIWLHSPVGKWFNGESSMYFIDTTDYQNDATVYDFVAEELMDIIIK